MHVHRYPHWCAVAHAPHTVCHILCDTTNQESADVALELQAPWCQHHPSAPDSCPNQAQGQLAASWVSREKGPLDTANAAAGKGESQLLAHAPSDQCIPFQRNGALEHVLGVLWYQVLPLFGTRWLGDVSLHDPAGSNYSTHQHTYIHIPVSLPLPCCNVGFRTLHSATKANSLLSHNCARGLLPKHPAHTWSHATAADAFFTALLSCKVVRARASALSSEHPMDGQK